MGAAYDADGNILGEIQAESFEKVLEELRIKHKDAAEYRLKDLNQVLTDRDEIARLKDRVQSLERENEMLRHHAMSHQRDYESLAKKLDEAERQVAEAEREITGLVRERP